MSSNFFKSSHGINRVILFDREELSSNEEIFNKELQEFLSDKQKPASYYVRSAIKYKFGSSTLYELILQSALKHADILERDKDCSELLLFEQKHFDHLIHRIHGGYSSTSITSKVISEIKSFVSRIPHNLLSNIRVGTLAEGILNWGSNKFDAARLSLNTLKKVIKQHTGLISRRGRSFAGAQELIRQVIIT